MAGEPDPLSRGNAGGNWHRELAQLLDDALAAARLARFGNHAADAAAGPARARNREKSLLVTQLTGATTLRTGCGRRTRRGAGTRARFARLVTRNLDRGLGPRGRMFEADVEV